MPKLLLLAIIIFISAYLLGSAGYPPWRSVVGYPLDFHPASPKSATVVTLTSDRRTIIIVPNALTGANADLRICPEPPADAADNIASLFTANAAAAAAAPGGAENKGSAALSSGSSAALASIFARSQGIELFRDGSNALCLAWLNDIYNNGDVNAWRSDFRLLLHTSSDLIAQEIANHQFEKPALNKAASTTIIPFPTLMAPPLMPEESLPASPAQTPVAPTENAPEFTSPNSLLKEEPSLP